MIWWEHPVAEPEAAQEEGRRFDCLLFSCSDTAEKCVCVCVCRGHSIKNNCCLSHLWLNEIWWLLLLMWPRLRYYLLLEVMAGLDKTHVSLQGVDFLICCRISELPSVSLPLHMLHTEDVRPATHLHFKHYVFEHREAEKRVKHLTRSIVIPGSTVCL